MIVLAIDPGGDSMGWAIVQSAGPRVHYKRSGDVASKKAEARKLVELAAAEGVKDRGGVAFALEVADGYIYEPFRGPPLLRSEHVCGGLDWFFEDFERPIVRKRADDVRRLLLGKGFKKGGKVDAKIKNAVEHFVVGLPAASVHQRDALALAVVASWELASGRR